MRTHSPSHGYSCNGRLPRPEAYKSDRRQDRSGPHCRHPRSETDWTAPLHRLPVNQTSDTCVDHCQTGRWVQRPSVTPWLKQKTGKGPYLQAEVEVLRQVKGTDFHQESWLAGTAWRICIRVCSKC